MVSPAGNPLTLSDTSVSPAGTVMTSGTFVSPEPLPPRKTGTDSSLLTGRTWKLAGGVTKPVMMPPEPPEPEVEPVVPVGKTGGGGKLGNGDISPPPEPLLPVPEDPPALVALVLVSSGCCPKPDCACRFLTES